MPAVSGAVALERTRSRVAAGAGPVYTHHDAGGAAASAAPPNVSYLVHKNTAGFGRTAKGRCYVPGVVESYIDAAGALDGTGTGDMNTAFDTFLTDLDAIGTTMVILHTGSSDPDTVLTCTTDPKVATQRRRLRK